MKDCLVIGGGIEALMIALMIKISHRFANITIKTINSDPRKQDVNNLHGATWLGLSPRHITYLEGYNRNILRLNDVMLQKTVSNGGWLGQDIKDFSSAELNWIARRISAQHFFEFNQELFDFYKEYNTSALEIWHYLISTYGHLFDSVNIKYGIIKTPKHSILTKNKYQEFSLSIQCLAKNIMDYLETLGVCLQFNTRVTSIPNNKNTIMAVGAYDHNLLKSTGNEICSIAGEWMVADIDNDHNFQVHTNTKHTLWQQNYTHIRDTTYILGGGYALAGFDYKNLCTQQRKALTNKNIELAKQFSPNIRPLNQICFRSFTDHDIPLLKVIQSKSQNKIILVGGMNTGTTTASPLTGQIVSNILFGNNDNWVKKIKQFHQEWDQLLVCNNNTYLEYRHSLSNPS